MIKKRLIGLLSDAGKYVVLNVVCQWISLLSQIGLVFTVCRLVGLAADGGFSADALKDALPYFLVLALIRFLSEYFANQASFRASVDVKRILREKIYEKLLRLGLSYREKISTAEVVQLMTEGVEQLETYFGRYLSQFFYSLLAPVTLFFVLRRSCLSAAVTLLVFVPLIPLSIVAVQKIAKRLLSKYWGAYAALGDHFLENLEGLTTLKIYQADEARTAQMDAESEHFRKITMKVLTMQLNSTSIMDIMAYGGAAAGMVVALTAFLSGEVRLEEALRVILLASDFFIPLRILGSYFHIAMNGMAASDKVFALLDLPEPAPGSRCPNGSEILLKEVCFSYPSSEREDTKQTLDHVTMLFPAGSFSAIAGMSGCGKSTVAKLLCGRLKGYEGEILAGGEALAALREDHLRSMITMVGMNSHIFKGTVKENLLLAAPEASDSQIGDALAKVNLLDYVNANGGTGMALKEGGSNLSGGQRQRLSIARALLADTPVYLFDEATSNIDAESEEIIMSAVRALKGEKTVILISHRLANVTGADCIYMMENGKVTEEGTHAELLKRKGAYARMYEAQRALETYAEEAAGETLSLAAWGA